ncbi:CAAX prenyl protease 1 homolog [Oppia nitens]|uniref:CAAX prenyl protease 1 homolog n=1 Tax=Oppia nitens TaxID=1686743 RepID=UPI0023DA387B|nr:CAAX prenyl protease 1 homolog [Oppia nitens]
MTCFFHQLVDNYWTPTNIFASVLVFSWIVFIWDLYLSRRQYKVYKSVVEVPTELIGVLDRDTLTKARDYNIDKSRFGFYASIWNQCLNTVILWTEAIPLLWRYSGVVVSRVGYKDNEILQTLTFVLIGSVISTIIDLPWSLYHTFIVEQKHGFNKQTPAFYAKDKLKKFVITQAIISPILSVAIWIVKIGGDYFFVYLWAFVFVVTLFLMTVYADYIAPLFDKFEPLPDGELKQQIEKLAASIDFPLKKLFVVEGSKRSSHSNAYFYGFHKNKRIVLFDTLLEDYHKKKESEEKTEGENDEKSSGDSSKNEHKKVGCNNDEVLAVLAHELGHWKLNHILKNLVIAQTNLFLCFMVFALLYKNQVLYDAFGFHKTQPVFIGIFIIFQYIFSPYNEILSFLMTCLGRRFEFGADAFAKQMNRTADLRSALIKLNKDNLGFPIYDWLYSSWYHSHPPLLERIRALGKID